MVRGEREGRGGRTNKEGREGGWRKVGEVDGEGREAEKNFFCKEVCKYFKARLLGESKHSTFNLILHIFILLVSPSSLSVSV